MLPLTAREAQVLMAVAFYRGGPQPSSAKIGRMLGVSRARMHQLLDHLEGKGYVSRAFGRVAAVTVTVREVT